AAVTREDLSGQPPGGWIPRQRLSLEQAILGYTLDAAYGSFDEKLKGSLEPGKLADIVILQQNLFSLPASRIGEVEVWRTLVGGRVVYSAAQPTP
ncbi:MAG TPA: amidohydrolase family protein, partial [Acidobacteriota bacterium]